MKNILKSSLSALIGVLTIALMLGACGTGGQPGGTNGQQQSYGGTNMRGNTGLLGTNTGDNLGTNIGNGLMNSGNNLMNDGSGLLNGRTNITGPNSNQAINGRQSTLDKEKAQSIKTALQGIKGISNVNVVVMGNKCVVGYNTTGNTKDTNQLRNQIDAKVKGCEKSITNVSSSSSPDVLRKISNINSNTASGDMTTMFNQLFDGLNKTKR